MHDRCTSTEAEPQSPPKSIIIESFWDQSETKNIAYWYKFVNEHCSSRCWFLFNCQESLPGSVFQLFWNVWHCLCTTGYLTQALVWWHYTWLASLLEWTLPAKVRSHFQHNTNIKDTIDGISSWHIRETVLHAIFSPLKIHYSSPQYPPPFTVVRLRDRHHKTRLGITCAGKKGRRWGRGRGVK